MRWSINLGYPLVWGRGEIDALAPILDPDFEITQHYEELAGLAGTYRGVEGFKTYWDRYRDIVQQDNFEPTGIEQLDPETFELRGQLSFRARYSGLEIEWPWVYTYAFRRGKLTRIESRSEAARPPQTPTLGDAADRPAWS